MRRKKHIKDTKANTYYERWSRAKDYKYGPFMHGDYRIFGVLKKKKLYKKIIDKETNDTS